VSYSDRTAEQSTGLDNFTNKSPLLSGSAHRNITIHYNHSDNSLTASVQLNSAQPAALFIVLLHLFSLPTA